MSIPQTALVLAMVLILQRRSATAGPPHARGWTAQHAAAQHARVMLCSRTLALFLTAPMPEKANPEWTGKEPSASNPQFIASRIVDVNQKTPRQASDLGRKAAALDERWDRSDGFAVPAVCQEGPKFQDSPRRRLGRHNGRCCPLRSETNKVLRRIPGRFFTTDSRIASTKDRISHEETRRIIRLYTPSWGKCMENRWVCNRCETSLG